MVSCLWVRLWLQARESGSPHLFLTCSGGGGGPMPSLSLLLLGFFTCFGTGCGACPTCADSVLGVLPVLLFLFANVLLTFPLFVSFVYIFITCPCLTCSLGGCAYWTRDVMSGWVSLGPLLALPGLCFLPDVLSIRQLLWHPAIDSVWQWPCLPHFRIAATPCLCSVLVVLRSWLVP